MLRISIKSSTFVIGSLLLLSLEIIFLLARIFIGFLYKFTLPVGLCL